MELYFARCHRRRAWIVAPNKQRALELATALIGMPSRSVSLSRIDDEICVDPSYRKAAS